MLGLILKDLYNLKKIWLKRIYLIGIVLSILAGFYWMGKGVFIIIIFLGMLMINSLQSLFIADKNDNWILFLRTINLPAFKIVLSRYLTAILTSFLIAIITILVGVIINTFNLSGISINQSFELGLITFMISTIYITFIIPFIYLFNQNGLTIGIISLIAIIYTVFEVMHVSLQENLLMNISASNMLSVIVGILVLVFGFSLVSSIWILNKFLLTKNPQKN